MARAGGGNFPDDEDVERGGGGNRWPRQETLALLKIRSDMDSAFRDSTLKGPLWEQVSRKLGELGYRRSAKKCKEKFENVHKYYKRTKESRAGRQDGKTYRFFSQLEALHGSAAAPAPSPASFPVLSPAPIGIAAASMAVPSSVRAPAESSPSAVPGAGNSGTAPVAAAAIAVGSGKSFSSNTSSSESPESDDEDTEVIGGNPQVGKRKRVGGGSGGGGGGSRKMVAFFEGLMKQLMERQEAMQQRFLEAIEKREQDRMIREEAWRRQEVARLAREQEVLAQERAMAATRDAAVISFIQKITGQAVPMPTIPATAITIVPPPLQPAPAPSPPPHPPPLQSPPSPLQQQKPPTAPPSQLQPHHQSVDIVRHPAPPSTELVAVPEQPDPAAAGGIGFETGSTSSRWPKAEVHALIKLRTELESRYLELGPKGPLWEEISAGMRRLGYSRNAKRCKEKWENINKYFKKAKESNKKRPEDSKTCPYFHQLDALYRSKQLGGAAPAASAGGADAKTHVNSQGLLPQQQPPAESETKTGNNNSNNAAAGGGGMQIPTSNGGLTPSCYEQGGGVILKKPEDIMKELMEQSRHYDSDNMEHDDDDFDEDEEDDGKMQYKIEFQRPDVRGGGSAGSGGGRGNVPNTTAAAAAAGSFLAMVQ